MCFCIKNIETSEDSKDFNMNELYKCILMTQAIGGYVNISSKCFLYREVARNYLRIISEGKGGYN